MKDLLDLQFKKISKYLFLVLVLLHVAVLVVSTIALLYYLPPYDTITALVYWFGIVASYLAIIVIAVVLLVFKQYIALLLDIFLISGWSVISYVYLGFVALPVVCDLISTYIHLTMKTLRSMEH